MASMYGDNEVSGEHILINENANAFESLDNTKSQLGIKSAYTEIAASNEALIEKNKKSSEQLIRMLQKTKNQMKTKQNAVERLNTQGDIIKYGTTDNKDIAIIERDKAVIEKETDLTVKEEQLAEVKKELVKSKLELVTLKSELLSTKEASAQKEK